MEARIIISIFLSMEEGGEGRGIESSRLFWCALANIIEAVDNMNIVETGEAYDKYNQ